MNKKLFKQRKQGCFVISLDFELQYGIEDKDYFEAYKTNILGGRRAIENILSLFRQHNIHATWAIVGMMFNEDLKEWILNKPEHIPEYKKPIETIYNHTERLGENEESDPFHYGLSLIDKISSTPNQELASHTYSHFYCNEAGASVDTFLDDIKRAVSITQEKIGRKPSSIVFPRNQINDKYIGLLQLQGFKVFRGCQKSILYRKSSNHIILRGMRLIDAYTGITGPKSYSVDEICEKGLMNVKASAMLRPYSSRLSFLESFKIHTIKRAMLYAAKMGQIYHLWWHPHNMGIHTDENLKQLQEILTYFSYLNKKYGMTSNTMEEVSRII